MSFTKAHYAKLKIKHPNLVPIIKAKGAVKSNLESGKSISYYPNFPNDKQYDWTEDNFVNGYSVAAGYATLIGPVEVSLLYNDVSNTFGGYIMVGFPF